ncbi:hypothetical protein FACS1894201_02600 [Bacteroidia bacterium]|nr:hypothetical protein FACS1894201_02600 [Bacteroidia bacterium]
MNIHSNTFKTLRADYPDFIFEAYQWDIQSDGLHISFDFHIPTLTHFEPTLFLPQRPFYAFDRLSTEQMDTLVAHIGLIELISYWKSTCSPNIHIKPIALDKAAIQWWKKLYFNGLGEFFYTNNIKTTVDEFMNIRADGKPFSKFVLSLSDEVIIPVGGGKDSVVTLELLRDVALKPLPMIVNPRGASLNCAKIAGFKETEVIEVRRTLDKRLLALNAQGLLNGHTPFSALLAFVTLLCAAITGKKHIALSNESSANEATDPVTGVNHQYSKSVEFEIDFRNYVHTYINEDIDYFSFLRPLNELTIAKYFASFSAYHDVFRSCNVGSKDDMWCCHCAKCLFAYIILSPFIPPRSLQAIFGENLLNNSSLQPEFEQLTGLRAVKPFECVGTVNEVCNALNLYIQRFNDNDSCLVQYFKTKPLYTLSPIDLTTEFSEHHCLSSQFLNYHHHE